MEAFTEHAGTAGLSGRDLCPADVLAADKYLTGLARAMKTAGITGSTDALRAHAYLHLLSGQPATTLLDPAPRSPIRRPAPDGGPPAAPVPVPGGPGTGPGLRGTVNLTMPLTAWLGWTQSPGEVPGFGALDAADSRALAGLLAQDPASRWCVTLTGPAGHPVAHACAPRAPRTPRPRHTTRRPRPPRPPALPVTAPPATGPPDWLRALTFTTLQTRHCTHRPRIPRLPAGRALRHLIEIRNPACTAPGCRRPAGRCDLDHVTPYDQGGKTCECNLGPACRHDHRRKQTPGWTGRASHFPDCGSFRVSSGKDEITWQENTGNSLLSSVRKRPVWSWKHQGRSWRLPANSGLTRPRSETGCGTTVRSTRKMSRLWCCPSVRGCGNWNARTGNSG